jgi:hypothetical protein
MQKSTDNTGTSRADTTTEPLDQNLRLATQHSAEEMYSLLDLEPRSEVMQAFHVKKSAAKKKERLIEVMQFHVVLSVFSLYSGCWRLVDLSTVTEVSVTASDGAATC